MQMDAAQQYNTNGRGYIPLLDWAKQHTQDLHSPPAGQEVVITTGSNPLHQHEPLHHSLSLDISARPLLYDALFSHQLMGKGLIPLEAYRAMLATPDQAEQSPHGFFLSSCIPSKNSQFLVTQVGPMLHMGFACCMGRCSAMCQLDPVCNEDSCRQW